MVYFRVDDGPTDTIQVPKAELTSEDALAAIHTYIKWKSSLTKVYEV